MRSTSLRGDNRTPATDFGRLLRLQRLGDLMDSRWRIPGTPWRIGVDGIVGLVPGVGDTLTMLVAAYIVREAAAFGLPRHLLLRMIGNVGIDWLAGSVPVIGSIFDIGFKANRRNLDLLNRHLERRFTA